MSRFRLRGGLCGGDDCRLLGGDGSGRLGLGRGGGLGGGDLHGRGASVLVSLEQFADQVQLDPGVGVFVGRELQGFLIGLTGQLGVDVPQIGLGRGALW